MSVAAGVNAQGSRVVFVQESPRFDVTAAGSHGTPFFLLEFREVSPLNIDRARDLILERLESIKFDPERDWIALTGPAILVATLAALAAARWEPMRLLLWDARNERYVRRIMFARTADPTGGAK